MKQLTTAAKAAKLIRQELKKSFPNIKFSVTKYNCSGGSGIDIEYIDGCTKKVVENIVNKYLYGHFCPMQDSYEYTNKNKDIPKVSYILILRGISEKARSEIEKMIDPLLTGDYKSESIWSTFKEKSYI